MINSLSTTTVLFRTTFNRTIKLNLLLKLQYIVLQSCCKSTIKCESNVEYNLTS